MSLTDEMKNKRYGAWAGNPNGKPYKPERCAYETYIDYIGRQCNRKKGHGPGGLYCKQHAAKIEKHKAATAWAKPPE